MQNNNDTIALVFDENTDQHADELQNTGAHRLFRGADGRLALEPVESIEDFERIAGSTGSFRRGKAIRDPRTAEVIGYEMEEIMDQARH